MWAPPVLKAKEQPVRTALNKLSDYDWLLDCSVDSEEILEE